MTRVIKRYGNRKLYDTEESRYVNLGEVFDYVRGGQDVRIVNNKTQEDITTPILLTALIEREKVTGTTKFTKELLISVISQGDGTLAGYVNNTITKGGI